MEILVMPQMNLPIFSSGTRLINAMIGLETRNGEIRYFSGPMPVFYHAENDLASFGMFISQLYINGNCTQMELVRAFGVSQNFVKRSVKKHREFGPRIFFQDRVVKKIPSILTDNVLKTAQALLNGGHSKCEVAQALNIKQNTFGKAIRDGRLILPMSIKKVGTTPGNVKNERRKADNRSKQGLGCIVRKSKSEIAKLENVTEGAIRYATKTEKLKKGQLSISTEYKTKNNNILGERKSTEKRRKIYL